jgi:hypothetical protein
MRSATAQIDISATPVVLWTALTSADLTPMIFSGLRLESAWQPDQAIDAYHCATHQPQDLPGDVEPADCERGQGAPALAGGRMMPAPATLRRPR